jgi:hypothetical protein
LTEAAWLVLGDVEVWDCVVILLAGTVVTAAVVTVCPHSVAGQTEFEVDIALEIETGSDRWRQSRVNSNVKHYWVDRVVERVDLGFRQSSANHSLWHRIRFRQL